jgi:predicted nuclease of predicted toxin-antitoxin system
VKFLVDNQLPIALSRFLSSRGLQCKHVQDFGWGSAPDQTIWNYACADSWILISKDEDFFYLSLASDHAARLIWVRIGNCRTQFLLNQFSASWTIIEEALLRGERVIELR